MSQIMTIWLFGSKFICASFKRRIGVDIAHALWLVGPSLDGKSDLDSKRRGDP